MLHAIVGTDHIGATVEQRVLLTGRKGVVVVDVAVLCIAREQIRISIAPRIIVAFPYTSFVRRLILHSYRTKVGVGVATTHSVPSHESAVASNEDLAAISSRCRSICAGGSGQSLLMNQYRIHRGNRLTLTAVAVLFRDCEIVPVASTESLPAGKGVMVALTGLLPGGKGVAVGSAVLFPDTNMVVVASAVSLLDANMVPVA